MLYSVEKKREIKNNKAQCLEGCSTLSITAPICTQGAELLSHSPSPVQVFALVNMEMFEVAATFFSTWMLTTLTRRGYSNTQKPY